MSSLFHLMILTQRYHGPKGHDVTRQEEPLLGNLATLCCREERASHHVWLPMWARRPWSHYYSTSLAPVTEAVALCESFLQGNAPRNETATKNHLYMCFNFDMFVLLINDTITERRSHKVVIFEFILEYVAKWPFGPSEGHLPGGKCFAPWFDKTPKYQWSPTDITWSILALFNGYHFS